MPRSSFLKATALWAALCLAACEGSEDAGTPSQQKSMQDWAAELGPAETFTWGDQPVAFSPPPLAWERQREQSGGLMGIRFVKYESGGQDMHVAEVTAVGKRDRCAELNELLRELDDLSQREFQSRLQRARPYGKDPVNNAEKNAFKWANERLDEARSAYRAGELSDVRDHISSALWDLSQLTYSLDDVVDDVMFTGEGYRQFGTIELSEPVESEVAGKRAIVLDYLFHSRDKGRVFRGRKVYVAHQNRLFEASFQGVEAYLPLFEAIVASISFPKGSCEH